jgi:subtilisin-like proprotein convertase family protein
MTTRSLARRGTAGLATAVLLGAALSLPTWPAHAESSGAPIRLVAGSFIPGKSLPTKLNGLTSSSLGATELGSYLVQFNGPVRDEWKNSVVQAGAELLEYIPDFAFKVRANPGVAKKIEALGGVSWVGRFDPSWKLAPSAKDKLDSGKAGVYRITVERRADANAIRNAAKKSGAVVVRDSATTLLVAGTPDQIRGLVNLDEVGWIEKFTPQEKHNESAGTIIKVPAASARGYDGSTQIAAVADTGLGGGTAATAHADIPAARITAIRSWTKADSLGCYDVVPDGAVDVDSGHGTHVAASVVGDGEASGLGKSAAPAARLVFQAVEEYVDMQGTCATQYADGYYLFGLPDALGDLFQQAYDLGARVHSNSWGSPDNGAYTDNSHAVDAFISGHRDMTITFSAGNEGTDANRDGVIDNDSIGSPATAKNVITVGASENERPSYPCDSTLNYLPTSQKEIDTTGNRSCAQLGGTNPLPTWGDWWPADYPTAPISTDPQAGNDQQMAAFSSRGPTDDGRIKPDIVAPGSWIVSGYSDQYQQGYDATTNPRNNAWQHDGYGFPVNSRYKYFSGTSMSNPIAASGAVIVRDFYNKRHSYLTPSAALTKATLINSADDLLDENNDGVDDNDFPIPNNHEGWGRINLDRATAGTARYVDEGAGLATGGVREFQYQVAAGTPLKVTMAYTDREAATAAAVTLVNDLDLELVAPDGTVYRGNVFANGWTPSGGIADRRNNVENAYIQNPAAGTWTVRVRGFNVPSGPQTFALVASGSLTDPANANPTVTNPGNQSTAVGTAVNLQIVAADSNGDTLTYAATGLPAGLSIASATGRITGSPTAVGSSNVTVTVTDGKGGSGQTSFTWTVTATGGGCSATNPTDATIPDNGTVESSITVSGCPGNAGSASTVEVHIVHTYIGDLAVNLVAPDGSTYLLHNKTGAGTDNIDQTYTVNLSSEVANGTWKLRAQDTAASDTGYINSWTLNLAGSTPPCTGTNGTDVTIPDNTTVNSTIAISGCTGNASSTSTAAVNIVHPYIGDLVVTLVAPDGSTYVLHNRTGSSTDNINKTYAVNLSGEVRNGTWTLRVQDAATGDTGYINSWTLTL